MTMHSRVSSSRHRRTLAFRGIALQGLSLVSIARRICILNHVTQAELLRDFASSSSLAKQAFDWSRPGRFEGEKLLNAAGISEEVEQGYAPPSYLNATDPEECLEEAYRFCPACEMSGWHFSIFQLKSLTACPGHSLALRTACEHCGIVARTYEPQLDPEAACWSCYGEAKQPFDASAMETMHSMLRSLKEHSLLTQHSHLPLGLARRWSDEVMRAFIGMKAQSMAVPMQFPSLGDTASFSRVSASIAFRHEIAAFDLVYLYRTLVNAIEQAIPTLSDGPFNEFCERIAATAAGGRGGSLLTPEEAAYLAWRGYWEARDHVWQTLDGAERTRMPHLSYVAIKQELDPAFFISQSLMLVSSYLEAMRSLHCIRQTI